MIIEIRSFEPRDTPCFQALNEAWIRKFFTLEEKDHKTFADPVHGIIDQGGQILIADLCGEVVGCCALLPIRPFEYEIAKMAVAELHRNKGIGRQLLTAAIAWAQQRHATRLYLETNRILQSAVSLYRSLGFLELDPATITPSPYARADVYMELRLEPAADPRE